jgi:hypothetical protein
MPVLATVKDIPAISVKVYTTLEKNFIIHTLTQ